MNHDVFITCAVTGAGATVQRSERVPVTPEQIADAAIAAARAAYEKERIAGTDFRRGPCIANPLPAPSNWVADVAHDPRRPVDDDPANQCSAYREGQADHFVELDPDGNVIRAK